MGDSIGPVIGITGESEFRKAIRSITNEVKVFTTALTGNAMKMEDSEDKMNNLASQSEILGSAINKQKEKVSTLEAAVGKVTDKYGENSDQVNRWKIDLNKARTELSKMENSLHANEKEISNLQVSMSESKFENPLSGLNQELSDIGQGLKKVALEFDNTRDKAGNLRQREELLTESIAKQKEKIDVLKNAVKTIGLEYGTNSEQTQRWKAKLSDAETELIQMQNSLKSTQTEIKEMGITLDKVASGFETAGNKLKSAGSSLKWISVGATAALTGMVKSASDYEESANKVEVVFKDQEKAVKQFAKTTVDNFGIAEGTALEMISLYGDMATSMDMTTEEAANMGIELVGRSGDLASFKNISLDVARNSLKSIFTGETESLKNLGVVMTETNLKQYMLAEGYQKEYKELTEKEKIMLRYNYVLDKTSAAEGDYARTKEGTANSTRTFTESVKELSQTYGEVLLPIVTPLINKGTDAIKAIKDMDEGTQKLIVGGIAAVAVAAPILSALGSMSLGISAIIGLSPTLASSFSGAIGIMNASIMGTPVGWILGAIATGWSLAKVIDSWINGDEESVSDYLNGKSLKQISAEDAQYYRNTTQVGFGDSAIYYAPVTEGRDPNLVRNSDDYSETTGDIYNIAVNVESIEDIEQAVKAMKEAQQRSRMG